MLRQGSSSHTYTDSDNITTLVLSLQEKKKPELEGKENLAITDDDGQSNDNSSRVVENSSVSSQDSEGWY